MPPTAFRTPTLAALLACCSLVSCKKPVEPAPSQPPSGTPPSTAELPVLDHFLCYRTQNMENPDLSVVALSDQFDRPEFKEFRSMQPHRFCNPVQKTFDGRTTPIAHPDHHLTYYDGPGPENPQPRPVDSTNQLAAGPQRLKVGRPVGLFVPTEKNIPRDHPAPVGLDHFKCYEVLEGAAIGRTADLLDELETPHDDVMIGAPRLFCNPTEKQHGQERIPIAHPESHLTCYQVSGAGQAQFGGVNQLTDVNLVANGLEWLCVPSRKRLPPPG